MSKIIIEELNSNDKDQTRNYLVKGEKGYSAYELYVRNGGTLTEEQWLDAFLSAENYYSKSETDDLLDDKVNTSDIKDNLTSTDTNKPLSAKQGKELKTLIDANTTAIGTKANSSDVYTKTDSDAKYVVKGDFAVVTGVVWKDGAFDQSNYPSGFSRSNCVVISFMISWNAPELENGYRYNYIAPKWSDESTDYDLNICNVELGDNNLITVYSDNSAEDMYYKLVLMKIS